MSDTHPVANPAPISQPPLTTFQVLLGTTKPAFLLLTPACISVGVGTAFLQTGQLNWLHLLLVLVGGVAAHACVNIFNEYYDFKSGLDARTRRTPFSGGSGALQARPQDARAVLIWAWVTFAVTALVGLYFLFVHGWALLPLGILGLVLLVTYTTWWVYDPVLCLIAPGLGFGLLMVNGTHFALTGSYSWIALVASLAPTFFVSNLLLINQFPDVEADKSIGRKHYPIKLGLKASARLYGGLLLLAYLSIIAGVIFRILPPLTLIALLTAPLAWKAYRGAATHKEIFPDLLPALGQNVLVDLSTPVLMAIGLIVSRFLIK